MNRQRLMIYILSIILFLAGLMTFLFPFWNGVVMDDTIRQSARDFLVKSDLTENTSPDRSSLTDSSEPMQYLSLYEEMIAYNEVIYANDQADLSNKKAYQEPSFILSDYGLSSEVFGVISIPKLDIALPIYLGATTAHMNDGAAHLSQTSLPIGGSNTNSVIAGHRGWNGASYFLHITELEPGDEVIITNLWEILTYKVVDNEIIEPNDVDKILIRPGKDMLTLLTCHPYGSGGKQWYLVYCERVSE